MYTREFVSAYFSSGGSVVVVGLFFVYLNQRSSMLKVPMKEKKNIFWRLCVYTKREGVNQIAMSQEFS